MNFQEAIEALAAGKVLVDRDGDKWRLGVNDDFQCEAYDGTFEDVGETVISKYAPFTLYEDQSQ